MITRLRALWAALTTALRAFVPHAPAVVRLACEAAGFAFALVFLHAVWPPLVWAAAAAVLLLAGQRR